MNVERIKRQIPNVINKLSETSQKTLNNLINKTYPPIKSDITDSSKDILNQLLYGEGVRRRERRESHMGYKRKTIK